jgi:hypothetical protein
LHVYQGLNPDVPISLTCSSTFSLLKVHKTHRLPNHRPYKLSHNITMWCSSALACGAYLLTTLNVSHYKLLRNNCNSSL